MRYWLAAAVAVLVLESAALACSCIATDDPAELKRFAAETAERAVALVEVEVVSPYDHSTGEGEVMRVVRAVAGQAPATFRIPRTHFPSSASCDIEYRVGQRAEVILYPAPDSGGAIPAFRTSGLCTDHLLDKQVFRDALMERLGDAERPGERG